ncbi:MAG: hypothetical protein R3D44_17680, partial [Hyphomicrobiaceae bacterium]
MLFVFAVLCAMLGGLLHLAAGMPAGTAALSALASVSLVVAANAVIRRRVMVSALNAEIAELRVEINGLRSARGAPPLSRTPYPAPIREPVPAGRGAAVDPSAVRPAGAPRGAYQPGPTAHSRPAALPPALQPPHGAASKPVLGAERPPQHSPHVMAA